MLVPSEVPSEVLGSWIGVLSSQGNLLTMAKVVARGLTHGVLSIQGGGLVSQVLSLEILESLLLSRGLSRWLSTKSRDWLVANASV